MTRLAPQRRHHWPHARIPDRAAASRPITTFARPFRPGVSARNRRGLPLRAKWLAASVQHAGAEAPLRCGESGDQRLSGQRAIRPLRASSWVGTLLLYAWSGSPGVDAVVTALVLAASGRSVSVPSHDRTDPSATRSVPACGDEQGTRLLPGDTCIAASAVSGESGGGVIAFRLNELVTGALTFRIGGPKDRSQAVDPAASCSYLAKS